MNYLAKGNWASLKHLSPENNKYDSQTVGELPKGNWHSLMCLSIDSTALNTVNAGMPRIGPHQLCDCQHVVQAKQQIAFHLIKELVRYYFDAHTPLAVMSLWPHLQKIFVFALAGA